jgi:drug/metabolite transporter (DMT)-like permease
MGIALGLTAAICWGIGDFLACQVTRTIGTFRTLFFTQFIGFTGLTIYLMLSGEFRLLAQQMSWQGWLWGVVVSLLNLFSGFGLYQASKVGALAVVSPIVAGYAALTSLLCFFSGETLSPVRSAGIIIALLGVLLVATSFSPVKTTGKTGSKKLARGTGWALLSLGGYGLTFWLLGLQVTPSLGGIVPVWLFHATTILTLAFFVIPTRQSLRLPKGRVWWAVVGFGVLDTVGFVANGCGMGEDQVSVVAVLGSFYTAITVLLAWFFLREKLSLNQWCGLAVILTSVILIGTH